MLRLFNHTLLLFSALLSSCSQEGASKAQKLGIQIDEKAQRSGHARLAVSTEPNTLHPHEASDLISCFVARHLYEGLTRVDEEGEPTLALAQSIEKITPKEVLVKLKPSFWSDGSPLDAYDFERSWQAALNSKYPLAPQMDFILNAAAFRQGEVEWKQVGIEAQDKDTLKLSLCREEPNLHYLFAVPIFFPVKEEGVSNGPFMQHAKKRAGICFKKNPFYWDSKAVLLELLELQYIESAQTALSLFEKGEIDWLGSPFGNISIEDQQRFKELLTGNNDPCTQMIALNTEQPPLNNPHIRKALALALDRQALCDHVLINASPAYSLVPPSISKQAPFFSEDKALAKQSLEKGLEELGLKKDDLNLTLIYSVNAPVKIVEVLQQQWMENLGLKVELQALEWQILQSQLARGDFQMGRASWIADFPDPLNFLELYQERGGPKNYPRFFSQEYRDKLLTTKELPQPEARIQGYSEAESLLMEAMPLIPLYVPRAPNLCHENFKGIANTPLGFPDFKKAMFVF